MLFFVSMEKRNTQKKIILITGGSSGIGLAIAKKLSESNDYVIISLSRSQLKIDRALKAEPALADKIEFTTGDIANEADCKRLASYLESKYGMLHGLVNNAAILTKGGIEDMPFETWKSNLKINLDGPFLLTKTLLPLLKKSEGASVVNISSVAALRPGSSIAYSVSKAGLDMLTEFLAGDLGPYQIRVNSINPGLVKTNIHLDNQIVENETAYKQMIEKSIRRYPIGRVGEADDIAHLAAFLLSDESSLITGSIIKADGGVHVYNDLIPEKNRKK